MHDDFTPDDRRILEKFSHLRTDIEQLKLPPDVEERTRAMLLENWKKTPWPQVFFVAALAAIAQLLSVAGTVNYTCSALSSLNYWTAMQQAQLFGGLIFCGLTYFTARVAQGFDRKGVARVALVMTAFGAVGLAVVALAVPELQKHRIRQRVATLFQADRYVAYEPPQWNPHQEAASMPTEEQIEKQLKILHSEGLFDGLVTFTARGELISVARLAKRVGFKSVILGIYVDRDGDGNVLHDANGAIHKPADLARVADPNVSQHIDGFLIGHNPPTQLDLETLASWMAELRQATGKPVSTTLPLLNYLGERGRALREIGDFYCPDATLSWSTRFVEPADAVDELRQRLSDVAQLPRDRPVLLTMVGYPSGPLAIGYTPEKQKEFFTLLSRNLQLTAATKLVFFSAYNLPWKALRPDEEFSPQEEFIGLFTTDLEPKPAVSVVKKGHLVQKRK